MDLVVSTYLLRASTRRSTLVFCSSVKTAAIFTKLFQAAGVTSRYVTGKTDKFERQGTISDFKEGLFRVLVNCQVFTEGADMPAVNRVPRIESLTDPKIDVVILARPTRSENNITQMVSKLDKLT